MFSAGFSSCQENREKRVIPTLNFTVSMPEPSDHLFHIEFKCEGLKGDTVDFYMPQWMPGYYRIMDYSNEVKNFTAKSSDGAILPFINDDSHAWRVIALKNSSFSISYDVYSYKRFVANNFLDSTHGYIIPAATFLYPSNGHGFPISLKVIPFDGWKDIATGLKKTDGRNDEFTIPDFDILYDCPILIGNLEELPSFKINGIVHRFVAYDPGDFDRYQFISGLEKTVRAGIDIIGDIPYEDYTFIGIGPGYGGIEHLNSTTISFKGEGLSEPGAINRMLKFIGHEYFHNYNVKRIRPFELGPFDYQKGNRTNLLWVSEGLTVYYEYLIVKRAGLMTEDELLKSLENNINTIENDPGRKYQSLAQSSYETWEDGPFGNKPGDQDKSISYYEKGPVLGMILDFSIRHATSNRKSLDDVMRFLYHQYYKNLNRGFTDAEFQESCEEIAGISLSREFEYINTTRDIDYSTYLSFAGLKLTEVSDGKTGERKFRLTRAENMSSAQKVLFSSWCGQ